MDIDNAILDTEKAYAHKWGSIALGTFLWNLYVCGFIVLGSLLLGLLIGCLNILGNHAHYLIWIGAVLIMLAVVGPFTTGYVSFIIDVIKNKRCHYSLLWSGFRNFNITLLIGFYIWSIIMAAVIVSLLFFMFMMIIFPVESENIVFKLICVGMASIFLIWLSLRVQLIPYFIYEDSNRTKSALSVIRESWNTTANKEGQIFRLLLRFTVLNLLSVLTLGILWYWILPYTIGSIYFFYNNPSTYPSNSNIEIRWSNEKIFTISFIIVFWTCFIGLALS